MDGMRTLSVQYPGSIPAVMNVAPELFEEEAKMAMAGVPRAAFLLQCHRFGVFSAEWSDEELAREFSTAF